MMIHVLCVYTHFILVAFWRSLHNWVNYCVMKHNLPVNCRVLLNDSTLENTVMMIHDS